MKEITDEEFFQIMDYLNHKTTEKETEQMERRRDNDPIWKNKIETVKKRRNMYHYAESKRELQPVFKQNLESQTASTLPIWQLWLNRSLKTVDSIQLSSSRTWQTILVAASVIVLLGLCFLVYQSIKKPSENLTNNDTIPPKKTPPSPRLIPKAPAFDLAAKLPVLINEPLQLDAVPEKLALQTTKIDREADRNKALKQLEKLAASTSDIQVGSSQDTTADKTVLIPKLNAREEVYRKLLLGIGYLKNNEAKKAMTFLNSVNDTALLQDVSWYKALAYLKLDQKPKARTELEKLKNGRYAKDAKELLNTKELKDLK